MKTIWKYTLTHNRKQTREIPNGFKVRHVAVQYGWPCVWIEVDEARTKIPVDFYVIDTGGALPPNEVGAIYVGTSVSTFVWHIFVAAQ